MNDNLFRMLDFQLPDVRRKAGDERGLHPTLARSVSEVTNGAIWTLKVKCLSWNSEVIRLIEIPADASLVKLHLAIQEAVDFDNDHLFEFYIGRGPRGKRISICADEDFEMMGPYEAFEEIQLADLWPLPSKRQLFYLFDFGDSWYFQIAKTRRKEKPPEAGIEYPRIIESIGENPRQYPDWDEDADE